MLGPQERFIAVLTARNLGCFHSKLDYPNYNIEFTNRQRNANNFYQGAIKTVFSVKRRGVPAGFFGARAAYGRFRLEFLELSL
jgi:hypothetical protein